MTAGFFETHRPWSGDRYQPAPVEDVEVPDYDPDIPEVRPVSPVAAALHGEHGPRSTEAAGSQMVVGEGEVVALAPKANQIVVEHGEIKGFMEAMTMGYRIDPPSLLTGLEPGDKVRFTIDVQRRAIVAIEKLR